jgi:hypothetical protein
MDSEYHLKQRIREQRYNKLPVDWVLLSYEEDDDDGDEKEVQVAAKTYGGISWSSPSSSSQRYPRLQQKIKGILNLFDDTYDHINNQMWTYTATERKQESSSWILSNE